MCDADCGGGLGGPVAGDEGDPLADGAHGHGLNAVLHRLGQGRPAVAQALHVAEERAAQLVVGLQRVGKQGVAGRDVRHRRR